MSLVDAVAVWDEGERVLTINLFPVALTAVEKEALKTGRPVGLNNKPSPNPQLWSWMPYAELTLHYKSDRTFEYYGLHVHSLNTRGQSSSLNRVSVFGADPAAELRVTAEDLKDGGRIGFNVEGAEKNFFGGDFAWSLQVDTTVHRK